MSARQDEILLRATELVKGNGHLYEFVYRSSDFTPEEKFTLKVVALLQEVMFKVDKTQYSYFLIDHYPFRGVWNVPIIEGEYIEHEMEAHLVQIDGLFDRIYDLLIFLFELNPIRKHVLKSLKNHPISKPLVKLEDTFDEVRKLRHAVVHEYRFDIPQLGLGTVIADDILIRNMYVDNQEEGNRRLRALDSTYIVIKISLLHHLSEEQKAIEERLVEILDECSSVYHNRVNAL